MASSRPDIETNLPFGSALVNLAVTACVAVSPACTPSRGPESAEHCNVKAVGHLKAAQKVANAAIFGGGDSIFMMWAVTLEDLCLLDPFGEFGEVRSSGKEV